MYGDDEVPRLCGTTTFSLGAPAFMRGLRFSAVEKGAVIVL